MPSKSTTWHTQKIPFDHSFSMIQNNTTQKQHSNKDTNTSNLTLEQYNSIKHTHRSHLLKRRDGSWSYPNNVDPYTIHRRVSTMEARRSFRLQINGQFTRNSLLPRSTNYWKTRRTHPQTTSEPGPRLSRNSSIWRRRTYRSPFPEYGRKNPTSRSWTTSSRNRTSRIILDNRQVQPPNTMPPYTKGLPAVPHGGDEAKDRIKMIASFQHRCFRNYFNHETDKTYRVKEKKG